MRHYLKAQCLCVLAFAVVLAGQGYEAFRKADESDTESALVDYRFYCRAWIKAFRAYP